MAQVINTNSLSLITQNNINKNQSSMSTAIERLSSGLRINSAKDDAAGQAIANRFTSNIKGLTQAARNANDGISLAQTTEGALSEINNNLQRIRELSVQSSTGTNSDSDLSSIQDEIKSRLDEIDRVSKQTQFNGVNVLAKDNTLKIQVGANDGETISIDLSEINADTLGLKNFSVAPATVSTSASVAMKSETNPTLTSIKVVDGTTSDNTKAFGAGYKDATNGAIANYFSGAVDTGDKTNLGGATDATVYQIQVDGQTHFVAQDEDSETASYSLLKQTATGYEKVTTKDADNNDVEVELANFSGRVTAFAADADGNAAAVDLKNNNTVGKALAFNDSQMSVYVDGKNLDVSAVVDKDGKSTGQYAAKTADGKFLAVNIDTATGNTSVITTADGKNVEYAMDSTNTAQQVIRDGDKVYKANVTGANATKGDEIAAAELKSLTTANPLEKLDAAIAKVDTFRSSLGAVQNRLDSAVTNLSNTTTNLSEAQSRIQDADYATEVSNMSKAQIIQQAGNSVLAKANQVPQQVLSLLQG